MGEAKRKRTKRKEDQRIRKGEREDRPELIQRVFDDHKKYSQLKRDTIQRQLTERDQLIRFSQREKKNLPPRSTVVFRPMPGPAPPAQHPIDVQPAPSTEVAAETQAAVDEPPAVDEIFQRVQPNSGQRGRDVHRQQAEQRNESELLSPQSFTLFFLSPQTRPSCSSRFTL